MGKEIKLNANQQKDVDYLLKTYGLRGAIELLTENFDRWTEEGINTDNCWQKLQYLIALEAEENLKNIDELIPGDEVPNVGDDGLHDEVEPDSSSSQGQDADLGDE